MDKGVCITEVPQRYYNHHMRTTGFPWRIHTIGCKAIQQYSEEVFFSAETVNEIECYMWADQISEGGMTPESVKGTIYVCGCVKKGSD